MLVKTRLLFKVNIKQARIIYEWKLDNLTVLGSATSLIENNQRGGNCYHGYGSKGCGGLDFVLTLFSLGLLSLWKWLTDNQCGTIKELLEAVHSLSCDKLSLVFNCFGLEDKRKIEAGAL